MTDPLESRISRLHRRLADGEIAIMDGEQARAVVGQDPVVVAGSMSRMVADGLSANEATDGHSAWVRVV